MTSKNTGSTWAQPSDTTIKEIHTFLALIIQMGHDQHGSPKDYCSREEQYCTPSYSSAIACNRFFHILQFLHFKNNANLPKHDDLDDRLWIIRKISDTLNNKFCEMYNPTEHLAVEWSYRVVPRRVIFWEYIPRLLSKFPNFTTLWATLWHEYKGALINADRQTCWR
jgi:hypothetical protein